MRVRSQEVAVNAQEFFEEQGGEPLKGDRQRNDMI